ncbi:XdhC family protein [Euzebya sp.]|uniref:XdhC family protein n=1 Tax=Euzebya sp. TaxID=1971409 RepID=UPI0035180384
MDVEVLRRAVAERDGRRPFVLCTVVWRRGPTSGQQGSKAIIDPGGGVTGFVGGACAEPTVVSEALASLADGQPRLLFLGQADELDTASPGAVTVPMACEGEGAMELYLEPHLPPPAVVVVGDTPAAAALVQMAGVLGWDARGVDEPELGHPAPDAATAVVVASQGHYDDLALRSALASDAGYVGLVASRKRADALLELLRDEVGEDAVSRVHAPAGLDLGRTSHAEIAVAVLADLVARRARGELALGVAAPPARTEATDPVCGMTVVVEDAHHRHVHDGAEYVFCAAGCKAAFAADPASFLGV